MENSQFREKLTTSQYITAQKTKYLATQYRQNLEKEGFQPVENWDSIQENTKSEFGLQ